MINTKYLILGGGISGLTFASEKNKNEYIIIEAEKQLGGLCKSFYEDDFVWDVAGHFFHFHSNETKEYFLKLMKNRELCRVSKCAKVYYNGKYMDAPFQYNIHQLEIGEFIECMTDLYFSSPNNGNSFKDYVLSKYGKGIANKFLIPYNEKLYSCNLNELEKDSMGSFLPKLDFEMLMNFYKGTEKKNTYNDDFLYPINGCYEIIDALLEKVNSNNIFCGEKAIKIDKEKKIAITNKNEYHYEYLINTIPFNSFLEISNTNVDIKLTYNKVLVLNFGFDKESIDKTMHWVYFPGNEIFYRVGFYNNITNKDKLSIYVEIGYSSDEQIDVEEETKKTLEDLKRVGIIDTHKVISKNYIIVNPAYVHLTKLGKEFVENELNKCEEEDVYSIGRYSRWQYSAMDDSLEQALDLAKKI